MGPAVLGVGGLPAPVAAAGAGSAGRGGAGGAGAAQADGRLAAGARTRGKSDPIDAVAVARAALREPDLPVAHLDGVDRQVRLLTDHREDLVAERTRVQQRLRWHLHELEPGWEIPAGVLDRGVWLDRVQARLTAHQGVVAELARELVDRCRQLTTRINQLEGQLRGWSPRWRRACFTWMAVGR